VTVPAPELITLAVVGWPIVEKDVGNQEAMDAFVSVIAGTPSPPSFFG
jgi:hypothetical protein